MDGNGGMSISAAEGAFHAGNDTANRFHDLEFVSVLY